MLDGPVNGEEESQDSEETKAKRKHSAERRSKKISDQDHIHLMVGRVSTATENEFQFLRQWVLAESYVDYIKSGTHAEGIKEVTPAILLKCIKDLRLKDYDHLQNHSSAVTLNSCDSRSIELPNDDHKLICQHPSLMLPSPHFPMACIILSEQDYQYIEEEILRDTLAMIFLFSGIDLCTCHQRSLREMQEMYQLEQYGKGTHKTFQNVVSRAMGLRNDVQSWISHCCNLDDPKHFYRNSDFRLQEKATGPMLIDHEEEEKDAMDTDSTPSDAPLTPELSELESDYHDPYESDEAIRERTLPRWITSGEYHYLHNVSPNALTIEDISHCVGCNPRYAILRSEHKGRESLVYIIGKEPSMRPTSAATRTRPCVGLSVPRRRNSAAQSSSQPSCSLCYRKQHDCCHQ